jgi:hypothetical protein
VSKVSTNPINIYKKPREQFASDADKGWAIVEFVKHRYVQFYWFRD